MENERRSELYLYRSTSLQIERLHLAKPIGDLKFEKERSERGSLAASSGYVDLAWGTWQHPTHV